MRFTPSRGGPRLWWFFHYGQPAFASGLRLVLKPVRGRKKAWELVAIWPK